jgi:hypothetical protein
MKLESSISIVDILGSISDDISLEIFKSIADYQQNNDNNYRQAAAKRSSSSSSLLDVKTKITRKQYYSRMNRILKYGLVKRSNGRYSMTSLGKVIQHNLRIIENACQIQWKLKAIDSLDSTSIPTDAKMKIADSLIEDQSIRQILFSAPISEAKKHSSITQQQIASSSYSS